MDLIRGIKNQAQSALAKKGLKARGETRREERRSRRSEECGEEGDEKRADPGKGTRCLACPRRSPSPLVSNLLGLGSHSCGRGKSPLASRPSPLPERERSGHGAAHVEVPFSRLAHCITADLDAGPIIDQDEIRLSLRDPVEDMIQKGKSLERSVLSRALSWHLDLDRVFIHNNKTVVFGY